MQHILVFEYKSKEFMNINKIKVFKSNLEKLEKKGKKIKMIFYGDVDNEELAVFMSYFNSLVGKKICDLSITSRLKEVVMETGINNKSIKLSAKNVREMKDKKFQNIIKEYYPKEDTKITLLPVKNWEHIISEV